MSTGVGSPYTSRLLARNFGVRFTPTPHRSTSSRTQKYILTHIQTHRILTVSHVPHLQQALDVPQGVQEADFVLRELCTGEALQHRVVHKSGGGPGLTVQPTNWEGRGVATSRISKEERKKVNPGGVNRCSTIRNRVQAIYSVLLLKHFCSPFGKWGRNLFSTPQGKPHQHLRLFILTISSLHPFPFWGHETTLPHFTLRRYLYTTA